MNSGVSNPKNWMRKKKQTSIDKRILKAECLRLAPEHAVLLLQAEMYEDFDFRIGFVHEGVAAHVSEIGVPEELGAHDIAKDISIPRVSCFIVLVTQAVLHHINRLPILFKHAVWETVDDIIDEESEIPDALLVIVTYCIEKAMAEINYNQLKDERVLNRLWNGIKSAYGERYAPSDIEIFDNFYEIEEGTDETE